MANPMTDPVFPQSADALLIALQTPAPRGNIGIPVLIWGKPGEGKSSFVEQLARPDFPVLTLIASIHDPTDFSGLPILAEGKVRYAVPEWVDVFAATGQGILFLDELTTAPPAVQAALLRVVLERKVGFHALPPGVRIIAAANPPDLMAGGWELSPPLLNRFIHLDWSLSVEAYLHGLANGYPQPALPAIDPTAHAAAAFAWKLKVHAFLRRMPALISAMPTEGNRAFPTPRTWDYAIALMAACEIAGYSLTVRKNSAVFVEVLAATVGESVAIPFIEFIRNMRLPDPDEVLDGKVVTNPSGFNDSEIFVLFGSLNAAIAKRMTSSKLPAASLRYLRLAHQVFELGKRDLIYVALKQSAQNGLLVATVRAAQKDPVLRAEVTQAIAAVFDDAALSSFVQVLEM